tara:strand:+ start:4041 stop:5096 length:1056 start_codon:yes stop_codon:yes gene_type:complete
LAKKVMRLLLLALLTTVFISCGNNGPDYTKIEITPVYEDSVSVRAIAPLDANRVWFAANKGRVGLIDNATPKLATIKYQDSLLAFRSIAVTSKHVFVLSIETPAVLYKIDFDGTEATNITSVYEEEGPKVFYDAMTFWNDQEGIAMGDPTEGCLSILITRDGGSHWEKMACEALPPTQPGEAAFAASNTNISVVSDHTWIATGGAKARVFYSPNKGKDWSVYNTPIVQGGAMTGIYSIDFWDENNGIIMGGDWGNKTFNEGNKAITKDGGKTWRLISNGEGPGYRSCVQYVPGTEGKGIVAVGTPGISYSKDGGNSWSELSKESFYSIQFVNDSIAFASGAQRISRLVFKK